MYFFINSYIYILQKFTIKLHIQYEVVLCLRTAGSTEGMGWWSSFGRRQLPNVTAVERLKSQWAMIPPMSTRLAMTAKSLRVMVTTVRKSDADVLHQTPVQERMTGRRRMLVAPVSRPVWPVRCQDCRRIS